ncbi:MAG: ribosomal-protein-alanine N-acetyltransferase [Gammaproteobacteria bacterium RIFCSPHIGHO2_12_FULL_38_14]|nr:MAG: ribosomal-protein-alanine N-acetyltransferase [Gammaproteobacteria bacterium RIFCSPHIGHO2_12_FULL_38_14]
MMIRTISKSDLAQLLAIEQSVHVIPWTSDAFKTCFDAGYKGWVIEKNNRILGFIIVSFHPKECHILNICIHHEHQRCGYGWQLLEHVINEAKHDGATILYLEVRRSNTRAITLYKKMNFQLVGERKNYYPTVSGHEDALVFARLLADKKGITNGNQ